MNQILIQGYTIEQLAEALKPLFETQTPLEQQQLENPLLTRDEVCKLLSFNKTSLWKHTKSGKLKSYGIGNKVFYKRSEVLEAVKPINH
ncbi:helix-turn-helix domain-containing protein [Flavobacterium sp. 7A]|uniref:helix-turn-helix domain-containing protein n=1 Tax=Flavobacterium sp. 7A TaxID=2940571 RepID=UPI0022269B3F|nr:helix-turn-helix domain-containing protein [Flavobacterium sp. 7A]MCW2120547.1 putative DNA-binding transcriptional regulator AlpA [Flavobacterium sp. 7A]